MIELSVYCDKCSVMIYAGGTASEARRRLKTEGLGTRRRLRGAGWAMYVDLCAACSTETNEELEDYFEHRAHEWE